jgi:4-deoxy-L-threo-5-hexosulose-uronate ketol-isomerase
MKLLQMADPVRYPTMTTAELRSTFLLEDLFQRAVVGGCIPTAAPLTLETHPELRADFFCQRRELGVFNVGGKGTITVDGQSFELDKLDTLYIGRGSKAVAFASTDANAPAAFYLLSYPAHAVYPTKLAPFSTLEPMKLGAQETCNQRSIYKAIHRDGIQSCQLVMGFTLLEIGSIWNTMPPHTHMRRSEIYFYFNVDPAHRVLHLMGRPDATSHIVLKDREVVVSPGWSIHAGVGTKNYGFCWGMGGENQDYADMDPVAVVDLK